MEYNSNRSREKKTWNVREPCYFEPTLFKKGFQQDCAICQASDFAVDGRKAV